MRARTSRQLYKDKPDDRAVRTALAEVRYAQGALADAKTLFDQTIKEFDAQKLNLDDPMQLYQLARRGATTRRSTSSRTTRIARR